jgi:phosphoribosylaminoimidazole-succinocarboxamide synthase
VLTDHGLTLIDMKLEFGRIGEKLVVIDALSGDTMRVYDPAEKKVLNQIELAERLGLLP